MAAKVGEPVAITDLREAALKRGASGIMGLGRTFRIYDDDGSRILTLQEFSKGLRDYGINLPSLEVKDIFAYFDRDGLGTIDFDEFLIALRPPMSKARVNLIKQAFDKLDADHSGVITVEDLMKNYNVDCHPKYKSGQMTKKQVLQVFLNRFQADGDPEVTWGEFLNYYSGVSASIDQDEYFGLMMRNSWKL